MDTNLLKIFITVAKMKSITLGAQKLKVTQTNVTLRIKQLEKNLGFDLFHRVPKGVLLTKEGEKLLPLANEIVLKVSEVEKKVKNIKKEDSIIIASTFSNAAIRLVPFLKKLNTDFPNMKLEVITNNTIPIKKMLLEYKIDIAFINHEPQNSEIMLLNKFENELLFIESKNEISKDILIAHEESCAFFIGLKKYYEYLGNKEYEVIELADFELILAAVEIGLGKSLLPKLIIEKFGYLDKLKITSINKEVVDIPTCLVCRKDNVPNIKQYLIKNKF